MESFILLLTLICMTSAATPEVKLQQGTYRGVEGTDLSTFHGIPYAKPPVGDFRFAKPQPVLKPSNSTFNASTPGNSCPQLANGTIIGNEDCLVLDIYTPEPIVTGKKEVMIWIHGGSFMTGAASFYDCKAIASAGDVVVVAINYRLTILGFLTTGNSTLPGNLGLWDQKLAIEWVKGNIESFGGDPSKITLFGESAGSRATVFQMLSPHNNISLFQRAITQSGSAMSLTFLNRDPTPVTAQVNHNLGCRADKEYLTCLRSKSISNLMSAAQKITRQFPFYPVVDGDFLPFDIGHLLADYSQQGKQAIKDKVGDFAKYELFSGWNNQEGLMYMWILSSTQEKMTGNASLGDGVSSEVLKNALHYYPFYNYGGSSYLQGLTTELFTNYYMNNPHPLISDGRPEAEKRLEVYIDIAGDVALKIPTIQHLQLHADLSNNNAYAYEFRVKRKNGSLLYQGPEWLRIGANHFDDVDYVLGWGLEKALNWTQEDKDFSRQIMTQWTNFAKTGNPGVDYQPFTYPGNQTYTVLQLGNTTRETMPLSDRQRLWSAVDSAIITTPQPAVNTTADCESVKGDYLSGLLKLTREEASKVMTGLVVGVVLAAIVLIVLMFSLIAEKCRAAKIHKA